MRGKPYVFSGYKQRDRACFLKTAKTYEWLIPFQVKIPDTGRKKYFQAIKLQTTYR